MTAALAPGRLLAWNESALLATLLGPAAPPLLRAGAAAGLASGRVRVAVAAAADGALTGLLAQGGEGCWVLATGLGAPDPAARLAAFEALTDGARLIVWDDEAEPTWLTQLAAHGARAFERRELVQVLALARHPDLPADPALTLAPWPTGPEAEALLDTLAEASAGTLNGVFLTTPAPPTRAAVRRVLAAALASPERPFRPDASFVARLDGRPIGMVLALAGAEPDEVLLFDLFVSPEARGRGVARRLVMALQAAALATGGLHLRFLTLGHNDPVWRLFHADELRESACRRYGAWQAAAPA